MKKLWETTTTTAKKRLDDLRVSASDCSQRREIKDLFFFSEQRWKLEHVCREVPDTSDPSDNRSEADRRCEEGEKDLFLSSTQRFFLQLYAINQAKDDHKERVDRGTEIKNQINKTFAAVLDANAVLQVSRHRNTSWKVSQFLLTDRFSQTMTPSAS